MALHDVSVSIRQSPLITRIDMFGCKHYLSLYADDVLLYISQPQVLIPPLLTLIDRFGGLSGYISWEKSELMPVSTAVNKAYLQSIPFKKSYETFMYLGVIVTTWRLKLASAAGIDR